MTTQKQQALDWFESEKPNMDEKIVDLWNDSGLEVSYNCFRSAYHEYTPPVEHENEEVAELLTNLKRNNVFDGEPGDAELTIASWLIGGKELAKEYGTDECIRNLSTSGFVEEGKLKMGEGFTVIDVSMAILGAQGFIQRSEGES